MNSIVDSLGKTRLRASLERAKTGYGPSVGQWMEFPGYSLARTVASLGVDWVLIDTEHGNIDDSEMYYAVGAVATAGASPIVRIAGSEPWMMKRALDSGAHGIMIPMCETKDQAEIIAKYTHYPSPSFPQGLRGVGGLFAPANFRQNAQEYLKTANDSIVVIVQIETRLALDNLDSIASTPGIDALFVGPNDLCSSMGYNAFDHPVIDEVQKAIQRILEVAKQKGKFAGHFALTADLAAERVAKGWEFVNCGADIVAISTWMTAEMVKFKSLIDQ
ncbi:MAG: hypothetical protein M1820_010879 [Bogoriella megaspora]|nr:MAG: hypothetical protein M1820_010879 [Bogoriella megaspora]